MIDPFMHGKNAKVSPPQLLILISVRNGKRYGYEILKDLREMFGGMWEPKTGVIYPAVKKLRDHGYLTSEIVDGKEHYGLSGSGKDVLISVLSRLGAMSAVFERFRTITGDVMNELGIDPLPADELNASVHDLGRDEKIRRLMDMRTHLETGLIRVNETIENMIMHENDEL
ncbi:MAG: PadR family transcriptional regulator [Methanomassiliicoccaceae archaeon]|nr:PadR family transcriptional regulator [Methanomassiliicoccaceae archaeon]